jgi:hypothetical protein
MTAAVLEYFTQTDPLPMGPGSAFESTYVYAGNSPLVYVDPSGLRKAKTAGEKLVKKNCKFIKDACRRAGVKPELVAKILMEENNFSSLAGAVSSAAEEDEYMMPGHNDPRIGVANLHRRDLQSVVVKFGYQNTASFLGNDLHRVVKAADWDLAVSDAQYLQINTDDVSDASQHNDRLNIGILILRMRANRLLFQSTGRGAGSPIGEDDAMILARKTGHVAAGRLYSGNFSAYNDWVDGYARPNMPGSDRFVGGPGVRPSWLDPYDKYNPTPWLSCGG